MKNFNKPSILEQEKVKKMVGLPNFSVSINLKGRDIHFLYISSY